MQQTLHARGRNLVETAPVREPDPARRGDYAQNRWAAARFGLDAELIHPEGDHSAKIASGWIIQPRCNSHRRGAVHVRINCSRSTAMGPIA